MPEPPPSPPPEPLVMPLRESAVEEWSRRAGVLLRRARVEAQRLAELLRSAQTPEGRQRNLARFLVAAAGAGFVVGLALGWRKGGR